ncbi:MAG: phosphodiester glycosidase family protein [Prevotellaceae bacterium]|jgi:exopolysaccharide biosynthesis protein|nr:phosphodiester glycosidase family protein [Prevotellaceae bacterium]
MNLRNLPFLLILLVVVAAQAPAQTTADSLAIARARWEITQPQPGIRCLSASFDTLYGVPQHVTILEINPHRYRFGLLVHTPKETTSQAARQAGAAAAINGSYFNMSKGTSICYTRRAGETLCTTTATGALGSVSNAAAQIKGGRLRITAWDKTTDEARRQRADDILVSGPLMLLAGDTCSLAGCNQNFIEARHPRSALARKSDGQVLLIAVAGRFPRRAEGMRIVELAHLARMLGAVEAMNLDGGGSTTLWDEVEGVVNRPTDNRTFDNQGERKVANSIAAFRK